MKNEKKVEKTKATLVPRGTDIGRVFLCKKFEFF